MLLEVKSVADSNPRGESGQRLKDALTGRPDTVRKESSTSPGKPATRSGGGGDGDSYSDDSLPNPASVRKKSSATKSSADGVSNASDSTTKHATVRKKSSTSTGKSATKRSGDSDADDMHTKKCQCANEVIGQRSQADHKSSGESNSDNTPTKKGRSHVFTLLELLLYFRVVSLHKSAFQ
ncbi:hypothetical protein PF003_g16539 [Phytophthora fragariae]|uniref:Uncharacterized protein n=1 Tax=Phytophthora fragariae TaxID=53985 RepID=A0A6A3ET15_9STRA|nr:hypothetical protein PF003_g16539 [Phytophthora fragariae]KAE8935476.1 hypothetical protein PF009_g14585 [Phytophthora fragariae]